MTYSEYVAEWNGKQVTRYGGQCVAGIAEYEAENNLPIVYGDAHVWIDNGLLLSHYDWVTNNPNDPNQIPPQGAIVVWPLPNEHIAFFDHNLNAQEFMTFGQNSGGPTMHFQVNHWLNLAGWYVAKTAPVPQPSPQQTILGYQRQVGPAGVNYRSDHTTTASIVSVFTANQILDFSGWIHGQSVNNIDIWFKGRETGHWCWSGSFIDKGTHDLEDLNQAVAPPAPSPQSQIQGAMPVPVAKTQVIQYGLKGYETATEAGARGSNTITDLGPGTYYVFNVYPTNSSLVNLSATNGKPGAWVDLRTDIAPKPVEPTTEEKLQAIRAATAQPIEVQPVINLTQQVAVPTWTPEKSTVWRATIQKYNVNGKASRFISTNDTQIELDELINGFYKQKLPAYKKLDIKWKVFKNGVWYGLDDKLYDFYSDGYGTIQPKTQLFGVPLSILKPVMERQLTFTDLTTAKLKKYETEIGSFFEDIGIRKKRN